MVDYYLNPMDTAPTGRFARTTRPRQMPPQPVSFNDLLQQATTQTPSSMLKASALEVPRSGDTPISSSQAKQSQKESTETKEPFVPDPELLKEVLSQASQPVRPATRSNVINQGPEIAMQQSKAEFAEPAKPSASSPSLFELMDKASQKNPVVAEPGAESKPEPKPEAKAVNIIDMKATAAPAATPEASEGEESSPAEDWKPIERTYTVQEGDTLSHIVAKTLREQNIDYSTGDIYRLVDVMASANSIRNPDVIYAGQRLDMNPVSDFLVARGESSKPLAMGGGDSQLPAHGPITSEFGMRMHPVYNELRHHNGVDIAIPNGTPIHPVQPGTVVFSGSKGGYGEMVDVKHADGSLSRYAHLSERLVQTGETVSADSPVGLSGETGVTTGPHLHLEIHENGRPVDPMNRLPGLSLASR